MKNKLDKFEINQVKLDFCPKESWFKVRTKVKDSKCENCGMLHIDVDGEIGLATFKDRINANVCKPCGEYLISKGAVDIGAIQKEAAQTRQEIIAELNSYDSSYSDEKPDSYYETKKLGNKKLDEIKVVRDRVKEKYEKARRIEQEIKDNYVDTHTEQYLFDDWDLFEDKSYLKHPELIEEYFKDVGFEYFDCGQGFYEDSADVYVKIGDKFYDVYITAEIESAKQDRGDKLYWVESIESVTYEESEKMNPKPRVFSDTELLKYVLDNCNQYGFDTPDAWVEYIKKHIIMNESKQQ